MEKRAIADADWKNDYRPPIPSGKIAKAGGKSVLINGCSASLVEADDRGLQYGDGLFETLAVMEGRPCLWQRHMRRLLGGCARLTIPEPDINQLLQEVIQVIGVESRAVVKIIITRGSGGRGYRVPENVRPNRIVQCFPAPLRAGQPKGPGIIARVCSTPVGVNPALAGMKTLNRLDQVLARSEWTDPKVEEGLMLDPDGGLVEGTMSNIFLQQGGELMTPQLSRCGVAGVMRGLVMELAQSLGIPLRERPIRLHELWHADGLFITNSLLGIRPVAEVCGHRFSIDCIDSRLIDQVMEQGFQM